MVRTSRPLRARHPNQGWLFKEETSHYCPPRSLTSWLAVPRHAPPGQVGRPCMPPGRLCQRRTRIPSHPERESCEPSRMTPMPNWLGSRSPLTTTHPSPVDVVPTTLPPPSGSWSYSDCKMGDSDPRLSLLADRRRGPREGRKATSGRSGTASPVSRRQGPP